MDTTLANSSQSSPDANGHGTPDDASSRGQFRRQNDGSNRKLVLMFALMLLVAFLIWLAYATTRYFRQDDNPKIQMSASSGVPSMRIDNAPKPIQLKDNGNDSRYAQLLALMQEKFALYDRLLASRQKPKPDAPLGSVIFSSLSSMGRSLSGALAGPAANSNPEIRALESAVLGGEEGRKVEAGIDDLIKPSVMSGEKATKMPNRNFLLSQGSNLECVLETAIDTSVPGIVTCILSRDIYSDSARVLLLEKGSKLVGEYRGSMRNGMRRLFLIWNRVVTPNGVAIKLGSPGTDTLGRAGVDGFVDNRYLERFGAALLVSLIADIVPAIVQAGVDRAGVDNSVDMQMTGSTGQQLGAEILRQNSLVPPVLRKNQGDVVNILVSRDLDFSSVYSLRLK